MSLKRGTKIDEKTNLRLIHVTDTESPQAQLRAMEDLQEFSEKQQHSYLLERAPDSLSHFIELMTPDEPPPPHVDYLCSLMEAMERRDVMRACISTPPGFAKSKTCSRMAVAWYLGRNPRHIWLHGGHSQKFAETQFGGPTRDIVKDPLFREVFPEVMIHPKTDSIGIWKFTNKRGSYVVKGVGQKIAGFRGSAGGLDDLLGSREDAHSSLVREKVWKWIWIDYMTRMLPHAPVFMIATRWHPDDPIGRIEAQNKAGGSAIPWEIVNLDAIIEDEVSMARDPMNRSMGEPLWDYYGVEHLKQTKAGLIAAGALGDWNALYKGKPRDTEGNVVKGAWFKRYDRYPENKRGNNGVIISKNIKRITVSVDCAQTTNQRSSYTVASVWIEDIRGYHYLVDIKREKVEYNDLCDLLLKTAEEWNADAMLVENKGHGTAFLQQYQGIAHCPLIPINPDTDGNKEFRFDAATPLFEAGRVLLPRAAPWLGDYEEEVLAFPSSTYKDQVDSTSQYLNWVKRTRRFGTKRVKII